MDFDYKGLGREDIIFTSLNQFEVPYHFLNSFTVILRLSYDLSPIITLEQTIDHVAQFSNFFLHGKGVTFCYLKKLNVFFMIRVMFCYLEKVKCNFFVNYQK